MTLDEVRKYFCTSYQFEKKTGMKHNNFLNWYKKGYIPIKTQMKLEKLTNGVLKASLEHVCTDE